MKSLANFFTVILGGLALSIWASPVGAQDSLEGRLQASLDAWRAENGITGATMAVAAPGFGMIQLASGLAIVEDGVEMTPDRRLLISSMTKTFVATAILQLVDAGELKLEDRIDHWFPEFPNAAGITIRLLLSHTSGATDYMSRAFREEFAAMALERRASGGPSFAPQELIDAGVGMTPEFPPGTSFAYSNTGYVLLGRIIEEITGEPLLVVLHSQILDPLGLQSTYLAGAEPIPGGWGPGYATEFAGIFGVTKGPALMDEPLATLVASSSWASGALVSTAGDAVRFHQALAGGKILQPSTLAEMIAPSPVIDDFVGAMGATDIGGGLGVFLYPFPDPIGTGIGHDGGEPGFRSVMLTFPAHGISVAVLTNDGRADFSIFPRGRDVDALLAGVVRMTLEEISGNDIRLGGAVDEGLSYQDPQGRFSVDLVGDWNATENESGIVIFDYAPLPVSMAFVAVETADLASAFATALEAAGIDPAALSETNRTNWNKWSIVTNTVGEGQGVTLLGQVRDGTSYTVVTFGAEDLTNNPPEDAMASVVNFTFAGDDVLPATVAEFEAYASDAVGIQPPGLSIVIAGPQDILYQRGFGLADGPRGVAATTETVFHWGSVTKTVTATAIMQLRDQGLLDLDAPIATYLDYVPADLPITTRHLLTHSSGLPEAPDFVLQHLRLKGEPLPDFDQVSREVFTGLDDLMFAPGTTSAYANPNYIVLGQIVSALSGQDYVDYVRDHIFAPLGLANTDFVYATDTMRNSAAHGVIPADQMASIASLVDQAKGPGVGETYFREVNDDMAWFQHFIVGEAAGGGLMGPATEMVRFGQMMLNNGGLEGASILSPESVAMLQEIQTLESGEQLGIGLSWFSGGDEAHPFIEHDGGGPGLQAKLRLYMKDGLAVAIMANGAGVERDYMADAAANVVFNMSAQ